jgi:hypothetical protein
VRGFANGEGIFAEPTFFFKAEVLHDNLIAQKAPVSEVRPARIAIVAWNGTGWTAKG